MLSWQEDRDALGVTEMDTRHREFVALLEALNAASREDFPKLFQELTDHARLHFIEEGRLMRLCGFPAIGEHEGEHHRILGELLQFNRHVKVGRYALARAYVQSGLPEWFQIHLQTMDSALARRVRDYRTGEGTASSAAV